MLGLLLWGPTTTCKIAPWHGLYEFNKSVNPGMVETSTPSQSILPWISLSNGW